MMKAHASWCTAAAALCLLSAFSGAADAREHRGFAGARAWAGAWNAPQPNAGAVSQEGSGNGAAITQTGAGNNASIRQLGNNNSAAITQTGANNNACLIQVGRNLDGGITQTGDNQSLAVLQTPGGAHAISSQLCQVSGNWRGASAGLVGALARVADNRR